MINIWNENTDSEAWVLIAVQLENVNLLHGRVGLGCILSVSDTIVCKLDVIALVILLDTHVQAKVSILVLEFFINLAFSLSFANLCFNSLSEWTKEIKGLHSRRTVLN